MEHHPSDAADLLEGVGGAHPKDGVRRLEPGEQAGKELGGSKDAAYGDMTSSDGATIRSGKQGKDSV